METKKRPIKDLKEAKHVLRKMAEGSDWAKWIVEKEIKEFDKNQKRRRHKCK